MGKGVEVGVGMTVELILSAVASLTVLYACSLNPPSLLCCPVIGLISMLINSITEPG